MNENRADAPANVARTHPRPRFGENARFEQLFALVFTLFPALLFHQLDVLPGFSDSVGRDKTVFVLKLQTPEKKSFGSF